MPVPDASANAPGGMRLAWIGVTVGVLGATTLLVAWTAWVETDRTQDPRRAAGRTSAARDSADDRAAATRARSAPGSGARQPDRGHVAGARDREGAVPGGERSDAPASTETQTDRARRADRFWHPGASGGEAAEPDGNSSSQLAGEAEGSSDGSEAGAAARVLPMEPDPATQEASEEVQALLPRDPDLLVLSQLGVDLEHATDEMLRLAAEYRNALLAEGAGQPVDRGRMALLDRGMAALLRVRPTTNVTVYTLLQHESVRPPSRYFANLLRGSDRTPLEVALASVVTGNPDPIRRASAVISLGPEPSFLSSPAVLSALSDTQREVRAAAVHVIGEATRVRPGFRAEPEVRVAVESALTVERDPELRVGLLQSYVGSSGIAAPDQRTFLLALPEVNFHPAFREAWSRALGGM